jgi:hypothetical protein
MIFSDPGVLGLLPPLPAWSAKAAGAIGAVLVVGVGRWLEQRILGQAGCQSSFRRSARNGLVSIGK